MQTVLEHRQVKIQDCLYGLDLRLPCAGLVEEFNRGLRVYEQGSYRDFDSLAQRAQRRMEVAVYTSLM